MQQQHSTKFLRQRKFLLVVPLLIIPFVTLAFWALGGGKGSDVQAAQSSQIPGLNLELPGAKFKDDKAVDKLGYYEKAEQDSAKLKKQIKDDPYFNKEFDMEEEEGFEDDFNEESVPAKSYASTKGIRKSPYSTGRYNDPNEKKVYEKLEQLNRAINESTNPTVQPKESYLPSSTQPALQTEDIDRLESMMQLLNEGNEGGDPEMNQLNGMLEKILDIQHPERIREKLPNKSASSEEQIFIVTQEPVMDNISLLDTTKKKQEMVTGFYGLEDVEEDGKQNAIEAVVHETQTLVNGAVVKMRLLNDVYINGHLIAKDNFVFGIASLNNERLEIQINSIRDEHSLFPVKLTVYDMDGLPGIYIPGAITRDVAKQSVNNSLQSIGMTSLDPSLGVQAASAGIETAKNLLSKKVKLVKVQVKAGYQILLKDKNNQL